MYHFRTRTSVAIANGATDSSAITGLGNAIAGIMHIPAAFTGASVSFKVATAPAPAAGVAENYQVLQDLTNTLISVNVTAGKSYPIPGEVLLGSGFKIVSASSEGAARTIGIDLLD